MLDSCSIKRGKAGGTIQEIYTGLNAFHLTKSMDMLVFTRTGSTVCSLSQCINLISGIHFSHSTFGHCWISFHFRKKAFMKNLLCL